MPDSQSSIPYARSYLERPAKFVRALAEECPILASLLEKHIKANSGKIVALACAGELAEYVRSLFMTVASGGSGEQELRGVLNYLENFPTGDQQWLDFIDAFVEQLPAPGDEGCELRELLGSRVRRRFDSFHWRPSEESVAFTQSIVERFPSLVPIMEEHTYAGQIVAGSFIADVGTYIEALFLIGRSEATEADDILRYLGDVYCLDRGELLEFLMKRSRQGEVRDILDFLEEVFVREQGEMTDLITIAFLQYLPTHGVAGEGIGELLGPAMLKQYDLINDL
jgi:hypothetical protein